MGHKALMNSHPKKHSKGGRYCKCCGNSRGLIRKYHMFLCRRCFRERAEKIGFIKLD